MKIIELLLKIVGLGIISISHIIVINGNINNLELVDLRNTDNFFHLRLHREYATVNQVKDPDILEFNQNLSFGNFSDYEFQTFIGSGASGNAYLGIQKSSKSKVVIKTFRGARMTAIKREIKLMQEVQGHKNISPLMDVIQNNKQISLVFTRYVIVPTNQLFKTTNDIGNKFFLYQTLQALNHAHSKGVVHADMKPANIITNPHTKMLKLIDWGLSSYYLPGKTRSPKVGTKSFKSPELLLSYRYYDYSTDIFSVGFMFSKMIFKDMNPFNQKIKPNSTSDVYLHRIAKVLGTDELNQFIHQIHSNFTFKTSYKRRDFKDFINDNNKDLCSDDALDLLSKLMVIDPINRITASEAMNHPYFYQIQNLQI